MRGNSAWLERDQGDFLTSEGKTREDGNHTRPNWVDLWGKLDGNPSGITSFCHPENFRAPQPVRLHPTKPYLCWSPCVQDDFAIEPGLPYTSRYRFFVHAGKLDVARARCLWSDYSQPAKVIVAAEPSATYPASSLKGTPTDWLDTAFVRSAQEYVLRQGFREHVEFRQQDIRTDIPAESFHLILCRNRAFTYFAEPLQRQVLERLTEHLVAGGFLVIGEHETLPAGTPDLLPCPSRFGFIRAA